MLYLRLWLADIIYNTSRISKIYSTPVIIRIMTMCDNSLGDYTLIVNYDSKSRLFKCYEAVLTWINCTKKWSWIITVFHQMFLFVFAGVLLVWLFTPGHRRYLLHSVRSPNHCTYNREPIRILFLWCDEWQAAVQQIQIITYWFDTVWDRSWYH